MAELQTTDYLAVFQTTSQTLCNISVDEFSKSIDTNGRVRVLANAPSPAEEGDLYWDTETGHLYLYYGNDGGVSTWVPTTPVPDMASSVHVRMSPPSDAVEGDMYWDTDDARMYVYYNNNGAPSWVPTTPVPEKSEIDGGTY